MHAYKYLVHSVPVAMCIAIDNVQTILHRLRWFTSLLINQISVNQCLELFGGILYYWSSLNG